MKANIRETINLPKIGVERLLEAMHIFESAQDEIEDFLILRNKEITRKINNADKERKKGKTKDFYNLMKKYA